MLMKTVTTLGELRELIANLPDETTISDDDGRGLRLLIAKMGIFYEHGEEPD